MSKRALDRTEIEEETESEERSYRFEDNEHLVSVATKKEKYFFPCFPPLQKHWLLYSQGRSRCQTARKSSSCVLHIKASASRHLYI
jgi:hypothetical protein